MEPFPVAFDTERPAGVRADYFPAISAVLVSRKGAARFLQGSEFDSRRWLRWLLSLFAYVGLLTDRLEELF